MFEHLRYRLVRTVAVAAVACGVTVVIAPAVAAAPASVDFTVRETLPASPTNELIGTIPGCASPTVTTVDASLSQAGPFTVFQGTKVFDCGDEDTFSLTYRAAAFACSSHDWGTWRVVGGTGSFDGVRGSGLLVGTYRLGDGPGTFCEADGIDDRYIGRIKL